MEPEEEGWWGSLDREGDDEMEVVSPKRKGSAVDDALTENASLIRELQAWQEVRLRKGVEDWVPQREKRVGECNCYCNCWFLTGSSGGIVGIPHQVGRKRLPLRTATTDRINIRHIRSRTRPHQTLYPRVLSRYSWYIGSSSPARPSRQPDGPITLAYLSESGRVIRRFGLTACSASPNWSTWVHGSSYTSSTAFSTSTSCPPHLVFLPISKSTSTFIDCSNAAEISSAL